MFNDDSVTIVVICNGKSIIIVKSAFIGFNSKSSSSGSTCIVGNCNGSVVVYGSVFKIDTDCFRRIRIGRTVITGRAITAASRRRNIISQSIINSDATVIIRIDSTFLRHTNTGSAALNSNFIIIFNTAGIM